MSHDPSEIIIICWFAAQEKCLIIIMLKNSFLGLIENAHRFKILIAFVRNIFLRPQMLKSSKYIIALINYSMLHTGLFGQRERSLSHWLIAADSAHSSSASEKYSRSELLWSDVSVCGGSVWVCLTLWWSKQSSGCITLKSLFLSICVSFLQYMEISFFLVWSPTSSVGFVSWVGVVFPQKLY